MVKGISRQVIVVQAPEPKLFEQAIFILRKDARGISEDALLKEANQAIHQGKSEKKRHFYLYGAVWAGGGAALMGMIWLMSLFL